MKKIMKKIIDSHAHLYPPSYLDTDGKKRSITELYKKFLSDLNKLGFEVCGVGAIVFSSENKNYIKDLEKEIEIWYGYYYFPDNNDNQKDHDYDFIKVHCRYMDYDYSGYSMDFFNKELVHMIEKTGRLQLHGDRSLLNILHILKDFSNSGIKIYIAHGVYVVYNLLKNNQNNEKVEEFIDFIRDYRVFLGTFPGELPFSADDYRNSIKYIAENFKKNVAFETDFSLLTDLITFDMTLSISNSLKNNERMAYKNARKFFS